MKIKAPLSPAPPDISIAVCNAANIGVTKLCGITRSITVEALRGHGSECL